MPLGPLLGLILLLLAAAGLPLAPAGSPQLLVQVAFSGMLILWPLWPCLAGDLPAEERGLVWPTPSTWIPGLVLALGLLPLFHLGVEAGIWAPRTTSFHLGLSQVLWFSGQHFLEVVLPEELFFRGYLQQEWDDGGGPTWFGVRWHRGLWLQTLAFGLVHVASRGGAWIALDRALPGLAFGFLKEKTGALWAPAVFHLACNLYVYLLGS